MSYLIHALRERAGGKGRDAKFSGERKCIVLPYMDKIGILYYAGSAI